MKPVRSITTALLFLGLAGSAFAYPAQGNSDKHKSAKQEDKQGKQGKKDKENKSANHGQAKHEQAKHEEAHEAVTPAHRGQAHQGQAKREQEHEAITPAQQHQQRAQQEDRRARNTQVQPAGSRPPGWDKGKKTGWNGGNVPPGHQARLPQERQRENITQQQQRVAVYRRNLDERYTLAQRYSAQLQQERRMASYRYQQAYIARLHQQQLALQRYNNNYNYNNDPYYYTAPSYRYERGGTYYETNQYGADALRRAVNNGYDQGFQAGQAARQDRWNTRYQDSYGYQDANYGYDGRYTDQDSYNYYFRQGFERGYDDGYNSRTQYGTYSNGRGNILSNILGTILNLQSSR